MDIINRLREDIIGQELDEATVKAEGFDLDKFQVEGSAWFVYIMDCYREYYRRHRMRIDNYIKCLLVNEASKL